MIHSNLHNPQNILCIFHLLFSDKNIQRDLPLNYVLFWNIKESAFPVGWHSFICLKKKRMLVSVFNTFQFCVFIFFQCMPFEKRNFYVETF